IECGAEFPWISASGACHDVKCIGPRRLRSPRIITPVLIFKLWQCLREPVEATLHGCVLHIETCFTGMLQKIKGVNVEPYGCEPVICLPESKLTACTLPIHQRLNGALDAIPYPLVFLEIAEKAWIIVVKQWECNRRDLLGASIGVTIERLKKTWAIDAGKAGVACPRRSASSNKAIRPMLVQAAT